MLWLLLLFVGAILFYIKVVKPHQFWKNKNVLYLKPWPILGNMHRVIFRRTSFVEGIEEVYKKFNARYFGYYQFLQPILMIKDIDLVKQIGVKEFEYFLDHRSILSDEIDPLFGKNLVSLKGQKWRHMRSTLSPTFTSSKMRAMFVLMSECADQFTSYFLKNSDPNKPTSVEMKDLFTRYANDVIATAAFGVKCDSLTEKENEFYVMGKRATDFSGLRGLKFFGYTLSPALMKFLSIKIFNDEISNFFRGLVKTTIETREKQGIIRPDMIHLLMEARKGKLKYEETVKNKDEDTGFATVEESDVGKQDKVMNDLTVEDITAQALIFFFAGFDTISTMMCFMAHELAINPDIQKRLQDEVDETLKNGNGKVSYDAITKMKYMDMVVSETLRKWPPAVITDRLCTKSCTIKSVDPNEEPLTINKGDIVWIPIFSIQRDPNNYPDPERFDPERFSEENKHNINPRSYLPFGVGPRNCIGSRFALLEAKLLFMNMLSKFDFVVTDKTQIPLKISRSNVNMVAENGFWLGLKPRNE